MAQINTDDQPYLRLGVAQRRRRQSFDLVSFIRFGSSPLRRVSSSLCYSTSISSHRNSGKKQATIKIRGLYEEVKLIANTVHRRFLHRHLLCRSGLVASQRISWKTCGVRYRPCPVVDGKLIVPPRKSACSTKLP